MVLHKWCAGKSIDPRLAELLFIQCERVVVYLRRLQGVIDPRVEVEDGVL